jgi:hypothetical protein
LDDVLCTVSLIFIALKFIFFTEAHLVYIVCLLFAPASALSLFLSLS